MKFKVGDKVRIKASDKPLLRNVYSLQGILNETFVVVGGQRMLVQYSYQGERDSIHQSYLELDSTATGDKPPPKKPLGYEVSF